LVGVAPGTSAPRGRRSKGWLALLLVPALAVALLLRSRAPAAREPSPVGSALSSAGSEHAVPAPENAAPELPLPSNAQATPIASGARAAGAKLRRQKTELLTRSVGKDELPPQVDAPAQPVERNVALEIAPAAERSFAPASPSVPAPTNTPSPPKYDLSLARVAIGPAKNVIGATASSVTRAVSEAAPGITACYKTALPQLGATFEGADVLHVDTDGAGVITDAHLNGPVRGSAAACIAGAVRGHRVANVDTGNASADVPLSFRDH
jgi:hypothetical protein